MSNVITPEVNAEGQYIGSSLEQRGEGLWRGDQTTDFIHDDVTGETRHIFEDVEIEDPDAAPYRDSAYLDALVELHGGSSLFQAKLAWAADNTDPSRIAWFNEALDRGDAASLNEVFDWLSSEYAESTEQEEQDLEDTDPSDVDEWFDSIDDEVLDAEVDQLLTTEFGEDEVEALEYAAQFFDSGSTESAIIMYGLSVANGEISIEDAIEQVTSNYGEAASYLAYRQLQQLFN